MNGNDLPPVGAGLRPAPAPKARNGRRWPAFRRARAAGAGWKPAPTGWALVLAATVLVTGARAEEPPKGIAIKVLRVIPVVGEPIDHGVILVKVGKIEAVGRVTEVKVPGGCEVSEYATGWAVRVSAWRRGGGRRCRGRL